MSRPSLNRVAVLVVLAAELGVLAGGACALLAMAVTVQLGWATWSTTTTPGGTLATTIVVVPFMLGGVFLALNLLDKWLDRQ